MKRDVKTVAEWDFERIIPCHGVRAIVSPPPIIRSNHFSHRTSSRRMETKRGGKLSSGSLTRRSVCSPLAKTICIIYKMQLRANNLYSLLYLSERWRGSAHGNMYLAGQEEHEMRKETVSRGHGVGMFTLRHPLRLARQPASWTMRAYSSWPSKRASKIWRQGHAEGLATEMSETRKHQMAGYKPCAFAQRFPRQAPPLHHRRPCRLRHRGLHRTPHPI